MKKIVVFGLLISFLISCSVLHVEKRRYRKGFHVSWNKKNKTSEDEKIEDVASKKKVEVNAPPSVAKQSSKTKSLGNKIKKSIGDLESSKEEVIPKSRSSKFSKRSGSTEKISVEHEEVSEFETEMKTELDTHENNKSSALYYFFLLGLLPVIAFQRKRGYKISKWASKHKAKAQVLIGVSTTVAVSSSFGLGNMLQWHTANTMLLAPLSLIVASLLVNANKVGKENHLFKNRLSFTMLNVGTMFGSFFAGTNTSALLESVAKSEDPYVLHPPVVILLFILLLALLVVSLYGLAVLSCIIACNGSGVIAVVVLLSGSYLAIFLAVLGFLNVFRRESERETSFIGKAALVALFAIIVLGIAIGIIVSL